MLEWAATEEEKEEMEDVDEEEGTVEANGVTLKWIASGLEQNANMARDRVWFS